MTTNNHENHGKPYTKEDIRIIKEVLRDSVYSFEMISRLANRLGRKPEALFQKLERMGLSGRKEMELLSANQLAKVIGVSRYIVYGWIEKHKLPAKREYVTLGNHKLNEKKMPNYLIHIDMFWLWARKNKSLIDFWKLDQNTDMPDWAYLLREKQIKERMNTRKGFPWKKEEENLLLRLLEDEALTVKEIASKLGRTEAAVEKKKQKLFGKRKSSEEMFKEKYGVNDVKKHLKYLYEQRNMTISQIALDSGLPESTMYQLLKRHDIKMNHVTKKASKRATAFVRIGSSRLLVKGSKKNNGYNYLKVKNHPYASKSGLIAEQRIVMEQQLGRFLHPWEKVMRKNGDKLDNRPENLYIKEVASKKKEFQQQMVN